MIGKSCTNYGRNNFNVDTCKVKEKEEPTIAMTKATIRKFRRMDHMYVIYVV